MLGGYRLRTGTTPDDLKTFSPGTHPCDAISLAGSRNACFYTFKAPDSASSGCRDLSTASLMAAPFVEVIEVSSDLSVKRTTACECTIRA